MNPTSAGDRATDALLASLRDAVQGDRTATDALDALARRIQRRESERRELEAATGPALAHDLRAGLSAIAGYADLVLEQLGEGPPSDDARKARAAVDALLARLDAVPGWGPPAPSRAFVLVVDDDEDAYRIVRRHLRKMMDCDVEWAPTGERALSLAMARRPTLITLDVCMPEVDGWETLARLKADPALAEVPVVMVSILQEQARALLSGASAFLTKPLDRAGLAAVFDRLAVRRGRVLVVDDTPSAREVAHRLLASEGYEVEEAVDGADALRRMAARKPDLVLLDLMMPEVDGFEVIARMEADPSLASIPVVVLTARHLDASERERLARSTRAVLGKGAPLDEVLRQIRGETSV